MKKREKNTDKKEESIKIKKKKKQLEETKK